MRISGWSSDVCSSDLSTGCVGSVGAVRGRLAGRSRQHLPDQPFRTVRAAAGLVRAARKGGRAAGAAPAILLPVRPSPALCRVLPRLLGDARDDGGAFAARGGAVALYADRDPARGARPARHFRRSLCRLSQADRKSTRLNPATNAPLVCRLLLETKQ